MENRRWVLLVGGVIVLAVVIGVIWGVADAGRTEASEATTTTVAAGTSTTSTPEVTTSLPETGVSTTTTEAAIVTSTTTRGDSGGPGPEPPPPNQPPVIEDAGISSDGMKLTIFPQVSDPENDPIEILVELDGTPMKGSDGTEPVTITRNPGHPDIGYVNEVSIAIRVTDAAGNEVQETFDHVLRAISTVTLRDLVFTVGTAACFEEEAAQRISANIQLDGAIDDVIDPSQELRSDRSSVTLIEELSGQLIGEPPSQEIKLLGALNGMLDVHEGIHTTSDDVFVRLFASNPCEGFLTYEIEMSSR